MPLLWWLLVVAAVGLALLALAMVVVLENRRHPSQVARCARCGGVVYIGTDLRFDASGAVVEVLEVWKHRSSLAVDGFELDRAHAPVPSRSGVGS